MMRFALRPEFKSSWQTSGSTKAQRTCDMHQAAPTSPKGLRKRPSQSPQAVAHGPPGDPGGPGAQGKQGPHEHKGPRGDVIFERCLGKITFEVAQNAVLSKRVMRFLMDAWENGARGGPTCSTVEKQAAIFDGCVGKWRSRLPKM